ncbi:D-lactate dehydrogenase [Lentilactobacillus parabuchneri]|jgi:D-lactate dehydrogenase|uniref:D-2-hydroxyacid dehydrogenase n=2 Tax=Lentilactobacillus parabuchneri TaxID=152331 RepID=A0A1X1FFB9_9LACO|nr:D-2-hydroxyacid dehydrogenase [Lentilactobacillus parabuchneri]APR07322.1 D-lactate dehydrogenase [Lentilactobacillus parabuchneri]KRM47325.1 D-lactate dehydrogenase [Lentilactobacillus parabuchneri DSM 5707 = NBRC 107865]KRN78468.1 D-lactate dehydrogenase [Lentilactobacillus parabuchneri]MBW0223054.1 D-2-hydroxyacid dehydrogenase [Lentilactobacillus parabuchneri]MBW0263890.1 D-2-hydroxyacid dehydrogenase [Lentilactobacillus parabuchneri]
MKKILAYNILGYEKEFVLEWAAEHPDVQVDFNSVELHDDTVDLAKSYDGIDYRQRSKLSGTPDLYRKLHEFGITQLALRSAGVDSCNLKWAKENGLTITNVPSYSPEAVAEMTLTHAMNLVRHIPQFQARMMKNDYIVEGLRSRELSEMTIGIIGVGRIGSTVAKIFKRFGARVLGNDIKENDDFRDLVEYTSKADIFKNADIITMHTYMSEDNYHMIGSEQFAEMKPSAFLINCSRGPIVDTDALIDALENKQIAGAGIDVIEDETEIFNQSFEGDIPLKAYTKLKSMDNVFLTPHVAFYTDIAVKNMVKQSLDDTLKLINGKPTKHTINV